MWKFWRRLGHMVGSKLIAGAIIVAAFIVLFSGIAFYFFESGINRDVDNFGVGFQWTAATVISGTQPFKAVTGGGKVLFYTLLLVRPGLLAVITAAIFSRLLSLIIKKGSGKVSKRVNNHMVICGWSSKGHEILEEIHGREGHIRTEIVILAKLPDNPARDEVTTFVSGDPTSETDLKRAGIDRAHTAIVLADNSIVGIDAEDMDSRTLMCVLAIETVNPDVYTCVEVVKSESYEHFQRTRANEILVSGRLTGALLAHSAVTHGLSRVVGDLLTHPQGNEFYWVDVAPSMIGTRFDDVLTRLKKDHDCCALAITSGEGEYVSNPPADRQIKQGDRLLVIAERQPSLT